MHKVKSIQNEIKDKACMCVCTKTFFKSLKTVDGNGTRNDRDQENLNLKIV